MLRHNRKDANLSPRAPLNLDGCDDQERTLWGQQVDVCHVLQMKLAGPVDKPVRCEASGCCCINAQVVDTNTPDAGKGIIREGVPRGVRANRGSSC